MAMDIEIYKPKHAIRVVTATSLFDGHDASINIIRRILQDTGVEVIHLGHNRSAIEIVKAAMEEDVQGIAVSSYQGGHLEFFKYMLDLLNENGMVKTEWVISRFSGAAAASSSRRRSKSSRITVLPKSIPRKMAREWGCRVSSTT
jgi:methylmalonyl-CoA mutase cobalamin-binding domain/chain